MRIALNATILLSPFTGLGQYTYQLAQGLAARPEIDLNLFYGTAWDRAVRQAPVANIVMLKAGIKRFVPCAYALKQALSQFRFTAGISAHPPDVYHEPNFLAFKCDKPSVVTVHDLSWIRFPHTHPVERVRAMERYFEPGLRRASLVITDSEFVKAELMDVFGMAADRIVTVPLGVEALFHPRDVEQCRAVLQAQSLIYGNYFLAVGTLEPRKNLSAALAAFSRLPASIRQRFPLVLAGMKGWQTSDMEQQMARMVNSGEVRVLGYLPREELAVITAGAAALVYPSIYEGFGLPPLEAMACGVPVIVSNVSSMPEVVGDAGIKVEPHDIESISHAMECIVEDERMRTSLGRQALERSLQFSWDRCVENTLAVYRRAVA
ncbi:glycosyltransferase family 4 protein [Herbaspirillum frisingense]|uniref:glycosyltransferase family 4 protein n=1 Tax=Herbaspirillum frisingense TaxID=92645 RepID=UPI0039B12209